MADVLDEAAAVASNAARDAAAAASIMQVTKIVEMMGESPYVFVFLIAQPGEHGTMLRQLSNSDGEQVLWMLSTAAQAMMFSD